MSTRQLPASNKDDGDTKVVWEFWKILQSEYHYREPGEVDLGDLDDFTFPNSIIETLARDPVLEFLADHDLPPTRENYLAIEYLGAPPAELGAEIEADLPDEVRMTIVEL